MKNIVKNSDIFQAEYETFKNAAEIARSAGLEGNPLQEDYDKLLSGYKKLLDQSVRLVNISDTKQEHLFKLQNDLKNILDNTGQGILTVDEDLTIHHGYSAECEGIFGRRIDGERFPALIEPYNSAEAPLLLESILNREFFAGDRLKKKVLLMLLPGELSVRERVFAVQYKPITFDFKERPENAFMIIMADITEKKALEQTIAAEKTVFKAITKIVADMKSFSACVREYRNFVHEKLPLLLADEEHNVSESVTAIFREVHTLKGNFAVFEIPWLVELLDEVEESLLAFRENTGTLSWRQLSRIMQGFNFEQVLEESLGRLKSHLGNRWIFDRDFVIIDLEEFKTVEREAWAVSPGLALSFRRMRYQTVADLLAVYPEYTVKLAQRLGKTIAPFTIESEEALFLDPEKYDGFIRSLTHVFRNMADHGIEPPEERAEAGKNEAGTIRCTVTKGVAEMIISISDDGRGIDVEAVRANAVARGLIEKDTARKMSREEQLQLIFRDGLSTSEPLNGISGRGVGLAAVKQEIERLGGKIEVHSTIGQGSRFLFHLPDELIEPPPVPQG